jgi:tetratricopeptide (TPR) repeat protein
MGVFELKQKNLDAAIANFNKSVREGTNKRIDGESYLRLGEIYYDTLRKYEISQAYYDSAISALPTDYEGYAAIKARQEILDDFVKNLNTIKWQDSLLVLSQLDSIGLRSMIDSTFKAKQLLAEKSAGKKKRKQSNRVEIVSSTNNIFSSGDGSLVEETTDWYFGNPSAMALGQTEFQRIWGEITLEDNWRRSLRSSSTSTVSRNTTGGEILKPDQQEGTEVVTADPVDTEFKRMNSQIPRTDEQKQEALRKIEDAYFNLGDIYYFKLLENDNAIASYHKLLERFPETTYEPEVLYKLYLIYKDIDPTQSESFAGQLKTKYPNSTFAKILINPDFLKESSQVTEKQKVLYKAAYESFVAGEYQASTKILQEASGLGKTEFTPTLELLRILIVGQTEDINQYQYQLDQFIKDNPESEVGSYAGSLLKASREFQEKQQLRKGIQYIRSLEEPHYFIIVYKNTENIGAMGTVALEKFNQLYFGELKLKTSNLVLNDDYTLTLVADLPRISSALEYIKTFNEKLSGLSELRNHKFHSFVITKDNFDIFYRTKGLDEYLQFFEKNYPAED